MKCTPNWRNKVPIVKWLPLYSFHALQCDFIAGITVALMIIPQGLAYAVIAGLPPQYGLYSAFMGGFVYCLLGSCKDLAVGPAAIMALMAGTFGRKDDPNFAITLSLACGIVLLIMGMLSLGFIVRIIPFPVISGFTSAAAVIIACQQLPNLLGLEGISDEFLPLLEGTFSNIKKTRWRDLVLGITCMVLLELLKRLNRIQWPSENEFPPTICQRVSRKLVWVVAIGHNAVIVFASALVAIAFHSKDSKPFLLTGKVQEGLPPFELPRLESTDHNSTITTAQMLSDIGAGLVIVPMIAFLTSIAIAQAFARKNQYDIDPNQELIALGICNVAGSFVSGFPIAGCFSRTTVNSLSGVVTPFGGVFTSCVVLLALSILTPFFQYIPNAALAAVIITSVLRMVNVRIIKKIWLAKWIDVVPLLVTFFVCLYEIAIGISCGIAVALIILLYRHFVPRIEIEGRIVCFVRFNGGLTYMGIEYFISKLRRTVLLADVRPEVVAIDCAAMPESDFTVTQGFAQIVQDCEARGIQVIIFHVQDKVKQMLLDGGLSLALFKNNCDEELCGLLQASDKYGTSGISSDSAPVY